MPHPSTVLFVWLAAVIGIQYLDPLGMFVLAAALSCSGRSVVGKWLRFVLRARWLLLTLWLVFAYNTPGEALLDLAWAPTYEGMIEACLHAVRLLLMLGCLAWLFAQLSYDQLVSGLWWLLRPLRHLGFDTERFVVRLSLVLENLQAQPEKGVWRQMLDVGHETVGGPEVLHLSLPLWAARDSLWLALALLVLAGVVVL